MILRVLWLAFVFIAPPAPAEAHTLGPEFQSIFDRVTPASPVAVTISQTQEAPMLTVRLEGPETLQIIGQEQEPVARIQPDGSFENTRSPTLWLARNPNKNPPRSVGADLAPRWKPVSDEPEFSYPEPRAEWPHDQAPPDVLGMGRRTTIMNWSIPASYGGKEILIEGHVDWVPRPASLELPMLLLGALAWGVWRFVSARTPQLAGPARAIILATLAAVGIDVSLVVMEVIRGDPEMTGYSPLLVLPGLCLVAFVTRWIPRSRRLAMVTAVGFGIYLFTFSLTRFLSGTWSFPIRMALATELFLAAVLLGTGFAQLNRRSRVLPSK